MVLHPDTYNASYSNNGEGYETLIGGEGGRADNSVRAGKPPPKRTGHSQNGLGSARLGHPLRLRNSENLFGRRTDGFKPPADVHLRVRFAAKMPGGGTVGGCQIPPENSKILISALDHEPVARIVTDNPTNFALEFFHTRHAFSVERWLGKDASIASTRAWRSSAVPTSRREGGN